MVQYIYSNNIYIHTYIHTLLTLPMTVDGLYEDRRKILEKGEEPMSSDQIMSGLCVRWAHTHGLQEKRGAQMIQEFRDTSNHSLLFFSGDGKRAISKRHNLCRKEKKNTQNHKEFGQTAVKTGIYKKTFQIASTTTTYVRKNR